MKRKPALIKFIIVAVLTVFGIVASFVSFKYSFFGSSHKYNGFIYAIDLGLDLKGGVYAVYEAAENENFDDAKMNGTVTQLTDLLTGKGFTEATVVREGSSRIRVEVPDVDEPEEIFKIIGDPATLEFILSPDGNTEGDVMLVGADHVTNAYVTMNQGQYVVGLNLNSEGASRFSSYTSQNVGQTVIIKVTRGGESSIISKATIREAISGGNAIISGNFDYDSASQLADQIMSGTFAVTLSLIECSVISPTLGENALTAGLIGGAIAFVLIMLFMIFFYKTLGAVAAFVMVIYMVLMFFLLAVVPWVQLSLPGIAGIILSLGMMIDGNVIINERIKEEYKNGRSVLAAYNAGFKKAAWAIFDGNITTIIAAVMLLIFGTGTVSGFGMTLLIGMIVSMFTSIVLTRFLLKWTLSIFGMEPKIYGLKRRKGVKEIADEPPKQDKKEETEIVENTVPVDVMPSDNFNGGATENA